MTVKKIFEDEIFKKMTKLKFKKEKEPKFFSMESNILESFIY
jgi:hypothetical protein